MEVLLTVILLVLITGYGIRRIQHYILLRAVVRNKDEWLTVLSHQWKEIEQIHEEMQQLKKTRVSLMHTLLHDLDKHVEEKTVEGVTETVILKIENDCVLVCRIYLFRLTPSEGRGKTKSPDWQSDRFWMRPQPA